MVDKTAFKIATWNVNSLRVRLPHVLEWLAHTQVDVLALQEIKLQDADFPVAAFTEMGYHVVYSGQRTYNGVAIVSRAEVSDIMTGWPHFTDPQRRVLAVTVNGVHVVNVYIPNGESVTSDKFQYKLEWLQAFSRYLKQASAVHDRIVVLGDFNIAPAPIDVHDPAKWEGSVLFSDQERAAFQGVLELGFVDCYRLLHPEGRDYSWWDYRLNAYKRNLGLRIDHILASDILAKTCKLCSIDRGPREQERPSDHAPVVAEFSL